MKNLKNHFEVDSETRKNFHLSHQIIDTTSKITVPYVSLQWILAVYITNDNIL